MRISEFVLENVTSYRDATAFSLGPELNIFIGPNGGGKTNAIQCLWLVLEKILFRHYKIEDNAKGRRVQIIPGTADAFDNSIERHDNSKDSYVHLTIIPDDIDADNVARIRNEENHIISSYPLHQIETLRDIPDEHTIQFRNNNPLIYRVKNGNLENPAPDTSASSFLKYCRIINLVSHYATFNPGFEISIPVLFFQSTRESTAGYNVNVGNLDAHGYHNALHSVTQNAGRGLSSLASQHFGRIKLRAIKAASRQEGGPSEISIFNADAEVVLLRKYLKMLGYKWDLAERTPDSWNYVAKFWKDGREIIPNHFSSGEREIFNFLYGVVSTNVRSGVVLIDEPELHLHPKWQSLLLDLFQEFAKERAIQFVVTTHSPAFVTHRTIDAVTRIYQRDSISRRATIRSSALPDRAQLVRLVHSHNNERIFFADRVVLVEGITDRLVLESLLENFGRWAATKETIEVIEVHGKQNFGYYHQILAEIESPTQIVADLDYVVQVGGENVRALFVEDTRAVEKKILGDKKSTDRRRLIDVLDEAVVSGSMEQLISLISYMKGRFLRLNENLNEDQRDVLEQELGRLAQQGIFIWRRGEIEDYLPDGVRSVGEVVEFLARESWLQRLDERVRCELIQVACAILRLNQTEAARAMTKFAGGEEETTIDREAPAAPAVAVDNSSPANAPQ